MVAMKTCRQCQAGFKPFHKADSFCSNKCRKKFYGAIWQANYRSDPAKKARKRELSMLRRKRSPDVRRAAIESTQKYRKNNPEKPLEWRLRAKYGVSLKEYKALGNRCHICGSGFASDSRDKHLDHDHASGQVRGLLCARCNHGLGHFRDDAALLLKAIQYLAQHNAKEIEFTA